MADIVFWLALTVSFLLMGALTHHFMAALIVTFVGALFNLLPFFFDGEDF